MENVNEGKRYYWFGLRGVARETPDNWISIKPVKVFGLIVGWWMTLAKKGYRWGDGRIQN
jgi:hypothetical protein